VERGASNVRSGLPPSVLSGSRIWRPLAVDAGIQIITGKSVTPRDQYLAVVAFYASAPTAHP